jgi:hypothetical protein
LATLGVAPGLPTARLVAEADYDALVDLGGMAEVTAPFLAARPARTLWSSGLPGTHVAPLMTHVLPPLDGERGAEESAGAGTGEAAWSEHRRAIEAALTAACADSAGGA